jgi:serine/threonine-protein kinase
MMAKDREQRYRTPEELILDLECLLRGEPPKLARQRIEAATLQRLAEGDAEHEDNTLGTAVPTQGPLLIWIGVLGGLLAMSVLLNVLLLAR